MLRYHAREWRVRTTHVECSARGTNDSRHGESGLARAYYAPNWVAEHLGASSRRPRHPFTAQMAGATPGRVPVYTAQKLKPSRHEQHLWSCTTGTSTTCVAAPLRPLPFKHELEVVEVVGANIVMQLIQSLSMKNTPNEYKGTGCN